MTSLFLPQSTQFSTASLIGQYSLKRTENALTTNIRNLSTGLQLHSGRDDPSAFVASSILTSEIAYMGQAVTNCKAADSICAVADSALAQISNILIDIRSLVTEAANTGASNTAMIEALQLQVDASLDTIDRIAGSTQFIDQKLLDGSLDFVTYGVDQSKVDFLQVNQANFMGRIEKDIAVKILQQAKQATLYYRQVGVAESVNLSVGGTKGFVNLPIAQWADLQSIVDAVNLVSDSTGVEAKLEQRATNGMIYISSVGENNDIILTASEAGTLGGNFVIKYTAPREGNDTLSLNFTPGNGNEPNCIEIVLQTLPSVGNQPPEVLTTAAQVVDLINTSDLLRDDKGNGRVVASLPDCTSGLGTVTAFEEYAYCGSVVAGNALQFLGPANSPNITFVAEPGQSLSIELSSKPVYDNTEGNLVNPGTLTVYLETDHDGFIKTTANDLIDYFNYPASNDEIALLKTLGISVSNVCESTGCGLLAPTYDPDNCETGVGCPTIRFGSAGILPASSGSSMGILPASSDRDGRDPGAPMLCACDEAAVGIIFYSTEYGTDAFVDVQAKLPNEFFPVVDRFGNLTERATGVDITATVNNGRAVGKGSVASLNTTELDMAIWINPNVREGDVIGFRITGGGALMQLGPDVDPTQQVRMAFQSAYAADIGGPSGYLSQLRYGSDKDLLTDTKGAYRIVEESILQITTYRGRLGSFQKYEVGRNLEQLQDLIEVASTMNSEIRDTDYAAESSSLAKNQLMLETIVSVIKKPTDNMRMLIQLLNR